MNIKEIEILKRTLSNMAMNGCRIKSDEYKVDGKIVGVGFKPYWSNQYDSKIEKLELNIMDSSGKILPFNFFHVIGYEVISHDGKDITNSRNVSLNIHVYSPGNNRSEPYDKVQIDLSNGE